MHTRYVLRNRPARHTGRIGLYPLSFYRWASRACTGSTPTTARVADVTAADLDDYAADVAALEETVGNRACLLVEVRRLWSYRSYLRFVEDFADDIISGYHEYLRLWSRSPSAHNKARGYTGSWPNATPTYEITSKPTPGRRNHTQHRTPGEHGTRPAPRGTLPTPPALRRAGRAHPDLRHRHQRTLDREPGPYETSSDPPQQP